MPQFDLVPYLSQAFWMLISFGFLYLIVAFLLFPMMDDVLSERETLIKTDLEIADKTNSEADLLIKNYNEYILSAHQEKANRIKAAYEEMHKASTFIETAYEKETRTKIKKTEKKLQQMKEQLHAESDAMAEEIATHLAQKFYTPTSSKQTLKRKA